MPLPPNPADVHTAKRIYRVLEAIPRRDWCTDALLNDKGQRCALGHLGAAEISEEGYRLSPDAQWLDAAFQAHYFSRIPPGLLGKGDAVASINDGGARGVVKGPGPKARVLSALAKVMEGLGMEVPGKSPTPKP